MSNPWYGTGHQVCTPNGVVTIRSRSYTAEQLQALVDAYDGDCRAAAEQVGMSRRMANEMLLRMGVIERKHSAKHTEYTHPVTGKTIRALYPWGTINRAATMYVNGDSTRDVANELGVPEYTIWNWMDRLSLARKHNVQNKIRAARQLGFTSRSELEQEVRRLRKHGASVEQIAFRLGASRNLVSRILSRYRRRRNQRKESRYNAQTHQRRRERRQKVAEMIDSGIRPLEIADAVGASVATIYKDINYLREAA